MNDTADSLSNRPCDNFLQKALKRWRLVEDLPDHDKELPVCVDAFLSSVVETYREILELTSADKQQVSAKLSAVREMCVKCSHEVEGGAFDGNKWKCTSKAVFEGLSQTMNEARSRQVMRQLQMCEHNLEDINKCKFTEIALTNFQRLLSNTARLLKFLFKYICQESVKGKQLQDTLLLCSHQLHKCFPLLLEVLEKKKHSSEHCQETKAFLVQRMQMCLFKIKQFINQDRNSEETEDNLGGGLFIRYMDEALSMMAVFDTNSIQKSNCGLWYESIQKVLEYAMLIAQVASQFDYKMIRGSSEKILRECEHLKCVCKSDPVDPALCKLYANSLSSALEELEQRVCAAVLRLYLQVFSTPFSPLEDLCSRCWMDSSIGERNSDDLSSLISAFDSHTECIIQVALFAIACSNDEKRVLGIRSCLASLESMEPQLVPALTSLYLRQSSPKQDFALMLVLHWRSEVQELWRLIDGIIDSAALAQVTRDAIWVPASSLKKALEKQQALPPGTLIEIVKAIVSKVNVFSGQLQVTFEELSVSKQSALIKEMNDLLKAVQEGKAVLRSLQQDSSSLNDNRVLKRCELLVSCVQRLQPLLEQLVDECFLNINCSNEKISVPNSKSNQSMKKVKELKQYSCLGMNFSNDAEIEFDVTDTFVGQNNEYSICNKTPKFTTSFLYKEQSCSRTHTATFLKQGSLRSHIFSRLKHHPDNKQNLLQETLNLDVTNILDGLNNSCPTAQACSEYEHRKNTLGLESSPFMNVRSRNPSNISSCSSFRSGDINTPERLQDLLHVQDRIDAVKISAAFNCESKNYRPLL